MFAIRSLISSLQNGSPETFKSDSNSWAKTQTQFAFPIDSRPIRDRVANPDSDGIEIIETGIEVVSPESNNSPPKKPEQNDGIIFLD